MTVSDAERTASTKGILRPAEMQARTSLRLDHPVAPELTPFVERYWSVQWRMHGGECHRSEILSHPCVNISVESGDRPRFGFRLPQVLLHGVVTRRFVVELAGWGRVTAAKFRPGGFAAYAGWRPAANSVAVLPAEFDVDRDRLLETVLAEDGDDARAAVLDAVLARRAPEPPAGYLALLDVLGEMLHDRGLTKVEQVASRVGCTPRSLQRLFAAYVGVGPKAVLARYRLHDAVAAIDAGEVDDLAALAAGLGWYDQAHFSRDFRAVVGTTPARYLAHAHTDRAAAPPGLRL